MLLFPVLLLLIFTAGAEAPKIIYVNASATGASNRTSRADAYLYFQAGVNGAAAGDSVFVVKSQALHAGVNSIDVYSLSAGAYYGVVNGTKLNFIKQ